jgi:uridine monophosphate synthetase
MTGPIPTLTYTERASYCLSTSGSRLFQLLDEKKTNLALSADVTSARELLELADQLGPEICMLKTHIDIVEDFTQDLTNALRKLAHKHRFLLFEDRKFADIGHTVKLQYEGGIYRIADWADLTNAHCISGPLIIQGLAEVGRLKNRGLILVAEMSSKGHLMDAKYARETLLMAEKYSDFVIGFITQHALSKDPHWINITPGIKLVKDSDTLGQQYLTPEKAILENGSDIIIVGRGIIYADDPLSEAKRYRKEGWTSYLKRCG